VQLLHLFAQPLLAGDRQSPDAFRLLAVRAELTKYLFNTKRNEHYFCKHCGIRCFGIGNAPDMNRVIGVNLGCLEDATPEELPRRRSFTSTEERQWHRAPAITIISSAFRTG